MSCTPDEDFRNGLFKVEASSLQWDRFLAGEDSVHAHAVICYSGDIEIVKAVWPGSVWSLAIRTAWQGTRGAWQDTRGADPRGRSIRPAHSTRLSSGERWYRRSRDGGRARALAVPLRRKSSTLGRPALIRGASRRRAHLRDLTPALIGGAASTG
jgi:hypothetical protein